MKVKPNPAAGLRLYQGRRGPVPSVTEVLGVIRKPWFDGGGAAQKAEMENAAVLGTRVHAAAVKVAEGNMRAVDDDLMPYAEAVRDFFALHVAEVIATERSLVSDKHEFGGTLDLYCRLLDGAFAVVDFKTTGSLTREHGLQVAAYAILCREQGWTVNRRLAVRIKKDAPGKFYARTYADHKGDVEAFLALKTYWYWTHKRKLEKARPAA